MTIRVLVADDQAMVRAGFGALLNAQDDIEVVGEAADGVAAVDLARRECPDVVLMDVRMPEMDGLEATRRLLETPGTGHRPKVLMLTTFDIDDYVFAALRAGASGFLLKDSPPADLTAAVRIIAAGESLLAPTVTRRLVEEFVRGQTVAKTDPAGLAELTAREREILVLIASGLSNREIAAKLFVAEQTVKTHVSRVFAKLGLRDRAQAVICAYETGLVRPGGQP